MVELPYIPNTGAESLTRHQEVRDEKDFLAARAHCSVEVVRAKTRNG